MTSRLCAIVQSPVSDPRADRCVRTESDCSTGSKSFRCARKNNRATLLESRQIQTDETGAKVQRLYDVHSILIATLLASLFAGAFLIASNFAALGDGAAEKALAAGLA